MKLEVEDKKEKQFVIEIVQTGEPADGFIVGKVTTTDGNAMKISGPESVVEKVKKAVVEADVSDLTDSINITENQAAGCTGQGSNGQQHYQKREYLQGFHNNTGDENRTCQPVCNRRTGGRLCGYG